MSRTLGQVLQHAAVKNGLTAVGQPVRSELLDYGVEEANLYVGESNIQSLLIYTNKIQVFDLTARPPAWDADQTWYTIGPVASDPNVDFDTDRPPVIIRANLLITNTPSSTGPVRTPLEIYNDEQWMAVTTPGLGTYPYPTILYDDYDFPVSKLYLWPYPNQAGNQLEILVPKQTAKFTSPTDTFEIGPEYENQFMLTIAERWIEGMRQIPQSLKDSASMARSVVKSVNSKSPKISTADSGTPGSNGTSNGNFYNGWVRN